MSRNPLADEVWQTMAAIVFDNRDAWRRAAVDRAGLPFSRVRVLRRLARKPMTAKELAEAATMDAPATSVAVTDLQERGLVVRRTDPTNRRSKLISLTEAGERVVAALDELDDPAPEVLSVLSDDELAALRALLDKLAGR